MKFEKQYVADVTVYLPLIRFRMRNNLLSLVHPEMAFSSNMNIDQII